jgi:flagella basal body P-ring formation protein FlgA
MNKLNKLQVQELVQKGQVLVEFSKRNGFEFYMNGNLYNPLKNNVCEGLIKSMNLSKKIVSGTENHYSI